MTSYSRLNAMYAFDLDPCATAENTKCERIFTKKQSGLAQSWRGCRVFMNPPYGSEIGAWVEKAAASGAFAKARHGVQFNLLKYLTELSSLKSARTLFVEVAMDVLSKDKVERIRQLNDAFRSSFRGGKILLTASVAELPDMVKATALHQVAQYKDFTEANDPNGTHDFPKFELSNRSFIFSIVAYDKNLEFESPDPTDPDKTILVGTLMQNSDW